MTTCTSFNRSNILSAVLLWLVVDEGEQYNQFSLVICEAVSRINSKECQSVLDHADHDLCVTWPIICWPFLHLHIFITCQRCDCEEDSGIKTGSYVAKQDTIQKEVYSPWAGCSLHEQALSCSLLDFDSAVVTLSSLILYLQWESSAHAGYNCHEPCCLSREVMEEGMLIGVPRSTLLYSTLSLACESLWKNLKRCGAEFLNSNSYVQSLSWVKLLANNHGPIHDARATKQHDLPLQTVLERQYITL